MGDAIPLGTLLFGGSHSLLRQSWAPRELLSGSVNADGWGVAWWTPQGHDARDTPGPENGPHPGDAHRLARAEPAWFDPDLEHALSGIRSRVGVAALRNATPGLPVDVASIPPLTHGPWAFVLNGFVPDFRTRHMRAMREALPDHLYAELRGVSDAETLFLLAVRALEDGASLADALGGLVVRTLSRLAGERQACHLTMLLGDGRALAVCRASSVDAVNSLYVTTGSALAPTGVLVASEPLDAEPGWEAVPPREVVRITSEGSTAFPL